MPEQQVYSAQEVDFGNYIKMFWVQGFGGDGSVVPANHTLELGRVDVAGRDAAGLGAGTARWRLQAVYVEPKKTAHLTFPKSLRLEAGGHVEVGFVEEGPGTILVEANGVLLRH